MASMQHSTVSSADGNLENADSSRRSPLPQKDAEDDSSSDEDAFPLPNTTQRSARNMAETLEQRLEHTKQQDPLTIQSQAESKLVESLRCPRKYFSAGKQQLTQTSYPKDEDGNVISPKSWKKLRVGDPHESKHERKDDVFKVRSLIQAKRWDAATKPLSKELQDVYQGRRHKHDKAIAEWESTRKTFFAWAEEQVESQSRKSRQRINNTVENINSILRELQGNEELLLSLSESDLHAKYDEIENLHSKEDTEIDTLERFLDDLENQRVEDLGGKLRQLVSTVYEISYELPDSFERYVEGAILEGVQYSAFRDESHSINWLILQNRKKSSEAMARLRKAATIRRAKVRNRRYSITQEWRDIHHEHDITTFAEALLTPEYTNPQGQEMLLLRIKEEQRRAHWYYRIPCLIETFELAYTNRNEEEIQAIAENLKNNDSRMLKGCSEILGQLNEKHRELLSRIADEVEALRVGLHKIGALHPPVEMETHCKELERNLEDEQLTELFREAGALKPTLTRILNVCSCKDVYYAESLTSIRHGLALICHSFDLKESLEKSGKETYLKSSGDLLKTMRTTSRTKIPHMLNKMEKQVSRISQVSELSENLRSDFEDLLQSIQSVIETLGEHQAEGDDTTEGGLSDRVSEGSKSVAESEGHTSGGSRAFAANLPMDEIRTVQRRFAMLLWAHELPRDLQFTLLDLKEKAKEQEDANSLIDNVIEERVDPYVQARDEESREFIERVRFSLWEQSRALSRNTQNVCTFSQHVVAGLNLYEAALNATVEFFDKSISRTRRSYTKELNSLEKSYEKWCKTLRESNSLSELETNSEETKAMINEIQSKLKERHDNLHCLSAELPKRIKEAIESYKQLVSHQFDIEAVNESEISMPTEDDVQKEAAVYALSSVFDTVEEDAMTSEEGSQLESSEVELERIPGIEVEMEEELGDEENQRLNKAKEFFENADETVKTKLRKVFTERKLEKLRTSLDMDTVDVDKSAIGEYKTPEALHRFLVDIDNASVAATLDTASKRSPLPCYQALPPGEVDENVVWTRRYHPTIPFRLLKFDSSFLQFLMRNRWKSKTQSNEEQKESRQKDVEQQAAKKLEEFYKNREPAPEKEKKKSKKPAPKTKKKEVAPTQEDNTQTEQEREQMEKEDQLARQLVAREFYLKKRFAPYAHGIEDEQGIPLDCAGQQCIEDLRLKPDHVHLIYTKFRSSVLTQFDSFGCDKNTLSRRKTDSRLNAYTEEYDEQTRLLQPRVGIIETQLRQPREYELLSHSKLLERHCKQFEERYKNVRRQWDNIRQGVPDVISEAKKQTRVHVKEIESETSVAKLQLVQEEHKKEVADYWSSTGDLLRKADHFISDEASKLTTLNNEFLRSCVSFRHGGDYGDEELQQVRNRIASLNELITQMKDGCFEEKGKWNEEIEQVQSDFENFARLFAEKLRQLQLEQGLGQRFGKPRRQALERIRSQYTKSERDAYNIQQRLQELDKLSQLKPGDTPRDVQTGIDSMNEYFVVEIDDPNESNAWEEKWGSRPQYMEEISSLEDLDALTRSSILHKASVEYMAYLKEKGEEMKAETAKRILSNRSTDVSFRIYHAPLSVRMRIVISWLCRALIHRANYLQYFKEKCRRFESTRPPVRHDVSPKPLHSSGQSEEASTNKPSSSTKDKKGKGGKKSSPRQNEASEPSGKFKSFIWQQRDFKSLTMLFEQAEKFVDRAENEKNRQEQIASLGLTQEELEQVEAAEKGRESEDDVEDTKESAQLGSTFLKEIEEAVHKCKADTKELVTREAGEFTQLAEDSVNQFSVEQLDKARTNLVQMQEQLFEQISELQQLLSRCIPLLVYDLMKRCLLASQQDLEAFKRSVNAKHHTLQNFRDDNASYLTPLLSDSNRQQELKQLQDSECKRQNDHMDTLADGYAQIFEYSLKHLLLFYKNLSFNLVAIAQDLMMCPLPEDVAHASKDMNDDENTKKMSVRRLKKRLQRHEFERDTESVSDETLSSNPCLSLDNSKKLFEALAGVAVNDAIQGKSQSLTRSTSSIKGLDVDGVGVETNAYRLKLWITPAIPSKDISVPSVPEWVRDRVDLSNFPHLSFMLENASAENEYICLVTFYNSVFRKLFGERDQVSQEYLANFSKSIISMFEKMERIERSVSLWKEKWESMTNAIQHGKEDSNN